MKVGLVLGGTDRFVRPIEDELRRRHECTRFTPHFLRLPLIGSRVNAWMLNQQLQQFIAANDVTFFEWASSLLVTATALPKRGRIVTRLHSGELSVADQVRWEKVDAVIVLNEVHLRRLRAVANSLPTVSIIANGVNLQRFRPFVRQFSSRLGLVCSITPRKRVYETIITLYQLRRLGHPFTLKIAGLPDERQDNEGWLYMPAIDSLIRRLGLAQAVSFCGHVEDVAGWLRDIDVFISNSYWEGQQIGLLEAMASGCYCLSHCWEGAEDILPERNIFVTESDLCARLIQYAELPGEEKQKLQAQVRALAEEKFDERRMVSQILELLERVSGQC